jgi:hypothetical protein
VAKYKKKRVRELRHDRFRDTTMGLLDRLGSLLEGRGRTILYGLAGVVLAALIILFFVKWRCELPGRPLGVRPVPRKLARRRRS